MNSCSGQVLVTGASIATGSLAPQVISSVIDKTWGKIAEYMKEDYACIEIPSVESKEIIEFRKYAAHYYSTSQYKGGHLQYFGNTFVASGGVFTDNNFITTDVDILGGVFERKVKIIVEIGDNLII
jgi:hypothetical protein